MVDTAIVILTGQSLNVWRGGTRFLETGWTGARQLVGGGTQPEMDFFSVQNDATMDYNETTSVITQAETIGGQSPIAGMASAMENIGYTRCYYFSAARGSADYDTLTGRGSMPNLYGGVQRLIELAAGEGDTDPDIFFYHGHGERAATNARTEQQYLDDSLEYFQRLQLIAAQYLGRPTYRAPIFFSMPLQNKVPTAGVSADNDITVKTAIRSLMDGGEIENLFILPSYPVILDAGSDLTHGSEEDYVRRGEYVGKLITDYIAGTEYQQLRVTSVTRADDTVTVQFSHNIARDVTNDFGSGLGGEDGFEYWDNGSTIAINSISYSGDTATITLASTPVGTDAQQLLHLGMQVTPASGAVPTNMAGVTVRKDNDGWASDVDVGFTQYDWALQEEISGLPYTYTPPSSGGGLIRSNNPALRHNDVTLQHKDSTLRHRDVTIRHNR